MKNKNTIPAIEKAVDLLNLLGSSDSGATQSEIVKEIGISGATCYRILQTLVNNDWLKKNSDGRYDLAYGFLAAGKKLIKNMDCFKLMQKPLDELSERTGFSTKLSVRKGFSEYVTMLRAEGTSSIAVTGKIGAAFPVIEGSVAGALLFNVEKKEIDRLLNAASGELLEKKEPEILHERISECRKKGFCRSGKRNRWNIEVISAPIMKNDNEIFGAISLLGFPGDFEKQTESLGKELIKTCGECRKILKDSIAYE